MVQNQATKRDFNKITFREGDNFSARILKINKESGEVILRLLDGRQFPAKIDGEMNENLLEDYLLKFEVTGSSDGKLVLLLKDNENKCLKNLMPKAQQDLLKEIINNLGLKISKGDEDVLTEMLKFKIPLTQENVDEIRSLVDFKEKIIKNSKEEDIFIEKYLNTKNVDVNSEKGIKIKNILKDFFSGLKELDLKSILMMKEENIPLTESNIKSFNNINKENLIVKNNLDDMIQLLENHEEVVKEEKFIKESLNGTNINDKNKVEQNKENTLKEISSKEIELSKEEVNKNNDSKTESKAEIKEKLFEKDMILKGKMITSDIVKDKIKESVLEMKENIFTLLKAKEENGVEFSKVMQFMDSKMQDFKMFNTLSNDYYYLNVPMDMNDKDYQCKLVIKDERGKGKKLDSKSMRIATSVKTINMNVVDAYINVNNSYINIDIHSLKEYMNVFEKFKDKLLDDLVSSNYVFNINIKEKVEEFTLSNCREFFDDGELGIINVVV